MRLHQPNMIVPNKLHTNKNYDSIGRKMVNLLVLDFLISSCYWLHRGHRRGVRQGARQEGLQRGPGREKRGQDEADCAGNR